MTLKFYEVVRVSMEQEWDLESRVLLISLRLHNYTTSSHWQARKGSTLFGIGPKVVGVEFEEILEFRPSFFVRVKFILDRHK